MPFNQETADKVCQHLREGLSLRKAAKSVGLAASTILDWTKEVPEFGEQYAQARARGYELLADEIIEISDDSSGDVVETEDGPRQNAEFTARSRLRVDSRKWMLSKMLPKVYGEKLETTHKGAVGVIMNATPTDEAL